MRSYRARKELKVNREREGAKSNARGDRLAGLEETKWHMQSNDAMLGDRSVVRHGFLVLGLTAALFLVVLVSIEFATQKITNVCYATGNVHDLSPPSPSPTACSAVAPAARRSS